MQSTHDRAPLTNTIETLNTYTREVPTALDTADLLEVIAPFSPRQDDDDDDPMLMPVLDSSVAGGSVDDIKLENEVLSLNTEEEFHHHHHYQQQQGVEVVEEERPQQKKEFRPGNIVWGKVEGHEWWPALVVRRRAVPLEVKLNFRNYE